MTLLNIDTREIKLIGLFDVVNHHSLDMGDIEIKDEKNTLLIERKTWNDLRASIRDGRFREQRSRLLEWKNENCTQRQIVYFVEGKYDDSFQMEKRTVDRLMIGYGIPVVFLADISETVEKIKDWELSFEKLFQRREFHQDQIESRLQETKKKNFDNPQLFLSGLLCQMKGITSNMAHAISEEFQSIENFVLDLSNHKENSVEKLKNITYKTQSQKEKSIPKSIIERLLLNIGLS